VLPEKELRNAFFGLPLISVHGPWSRAIKFEYLQQEDPQPLWAGGAVEYGARFIPKGGFDGVHLASDPFTAFLEVEAVFITAAGKVVSDTNPPWTWVTVEGVVENVVDLTDSVLWERFRTSESELTGNWRPGQDRHLRGEGPLPPTQVFGKVAYETGRALGIRYPSAKNTGKGVNLVIFPDRLQKGGGSYLQVYDPKKLLNQRLP
jgi:RES domain-containing protein